MQKIKNKFARRKCKKIRNGDKVVVTAGNCRGQSGTVIKCLENDRVLIQGVNLRKKHVKPTQENPSGGILDIERPLHISNIQVCDDEEKPVKLKVKMSDKGEKSFVYTKGGNEVVYRDVKKSKI